MNSTQQAISRRERHERRICTGTRAIEWLLCAASLWAALVMAWTPTAFRAAQPPFYKIINDSFSAITIGICIGVVPLVHLVGLYFSSCEGCKNRDDSENCRREKWGSYLRYWGAKGQFCVWLFLTTIYVLLWLQKSEVTLGSGICAIFLVCSSGISYCISAERSRNRARAEVALELKNRDAASVSAVK